MREHVPTRVLLELPRALSWELRLSWLEALEAARHVPIAKAKFDQPALEFRLLRPCGQWHSRPESISRCKTPTKNMLRRAFPSQ